MICSRQEMYVPEEVRASVGLAATVVAGCGRQGYSGDGGPATQAELNEPYEVRFDESGNMYFVEMQNNIIRRVDSETGKVTTLAGTGEAGFSGDGGPATEARDSPGAAREAD